MKKWMRVKNVDERDEWKKIYEYECKRWVWESEYRKWEKKVLDD